MPADPQQIQREIEATRAELAATVEAIADKVSPKKVAARSAKTAKDAALTKGLAAYAVLENTFAPVPVPPPLPPLPLSKRLKWDRVGSVLIAIGALILAIITLRNRKPKSKRDQLRSQGADLVKQSRKARKGAKKSARRVRKDPLGSAQHLAEVAPGHARQALGAAQHVVEAAPGQAKRALDVAHDQVVAAAAAANHLTVKSSKAAKKQQAKKAKAAKKLVAAQAKAVENQAKSATKAAKASGVAQVKATTAKRAKENAS